MKRLLAGVLGRFALTMAVMVMSACTAVADDRSDYNRRAAEADRAAFRELDLDRDGRLTRNELLPDVDRASRFVDADIDRDGVITEAEIRRYVAQTYDRDER